MLVTVYEGWIGVGVGGQQVLQCALSAPTGHTPTRLVSLLPYIWNEEVHNVDQVNEYS